MEAIWEVTWRLYPASLLALAGALIALTGVRRQVVGIMRPVREPGKGLAWMRGFRQTVIGLAVLGVAAAWLLDAPWLLALALIIGAGELFESSLDIWALTKGKDFRITPRVTPPR
jgi:hypothetical protein